MPEWQAEPAHQVIPQVPTSTGMAVEEVGRGGEEQRNGTISSKA